MLRLFMSVADFPKLIMSTRFIISKDKPTKLNRPQELIWRTMSAKYLTVLTDAEHCKRAIEIICVLLSVITNSKLELLSKPIFPDISLIRELKINKVADRYEFLLGFDNNARIKTIEGYMGALFMPLRSILTEYDALLTAEEHIPLMTNYYIGEQKVEHLVDSFPKFADR